MQRELSFLYKGVDAKNHQVFPLKTIQKARFRNTLQGNKYKCSLSLRTGLARDSPGPICSQGYFPPFPMYTFPTDVLFSPATSSLIHLSTPSCAQFRLKCKSLKNAYTQMSRHLLPLVSDIEGRRTYKHILYVHLWTLHSFPKRFFERRSVAFLNDECVLNICYIQVLLSTLAHSKLIKT